MLKTKCGSGRQSLLSSTKIERDPQGNPLSELNPFLSFTFRTTFHNEKTVIFFNDSFGNILVTSLIQDSYILVFVSQICNQIEHY